MPPDLNKSVRLKKCPISLIDNTCLSRKHRYYRCRSTSATAVKGKTCNGRYIRADYIEDVVWENVREVLEHPETIITELKRQAEEQSNLSNSKSDIDKDIKGLERRLRSYEKQERNLISLLRHSQVTQDFVLDEVNRLRKERQNDEEELRQMQETKAKISNIEDAEIKLNEFCQRVRKNLDNATIQDKRLALDALDIRITASKQKIDIKGVIPIEMTTSSTSNVTTIEQTSA